MFTYRLRTDFEDIQRKEDAAGNLKVTAAMIRIVFVETKKYIPFESHSSLVLLQELNEVNMAAVNMGHHHFERYGAVAMLESLGAQMHKLLIEHMISANVPFSVIIDGSTDSVGNKYLIMYFQILENIIPIMCFYRLIEASSDITAKGFYESISTAFQSEKQDLKNSAAFFAILT